MRRRRTSDNPTYNEEDEDDNHDKEDEHGKEDDENDEIEGVA